MHVRTIYQSKSLIDVNICLSENTMDDFVDWECIYCGKHFTTEQKMKVHQKKKQDNKFVGCKINYDKRMRKAGSSSVTASTAGSLTSSGFTFPLDDCPPSDDLLDEIIGSELNEAEVAVGRGSVPPMRDSLQHSLKDLKVAMSRSLRGKIIHGPTVNNVVLPTVSRLYGEVAKVVECVLAHPEFDATKDRSKVVEIRRRRNHVFEQIAVNVNQDNAISKHECKASECSSECTYAKRRTLFHIQQTLFNLQVAASRKGYTETWITKAAAHLRRVLVEDRGTYSGVVALVFNVFGPELGPRLDPLKLETASVGVAPAPANPPAPARSAVPLEVSIATLEKGANR